MWMPQIRQWRSSTSCIRTSAAPMLALACQALTRRRWANCTRCSKTPTPEGKPRSSLTTCVPPRKAMRKRLGARRLGPAPSSSAARREQLALALARVRVRVRVRALVRVLGRVRVRVAKSRLRAPGAIGRATSRACWRKCYARRLGIRRRISSASAVRPARTWKRSSVDSVRRWTRNWLAVASSRRALRRAVLATLPDSRRVR